MPKKPAEIIPMPPRAGNIIRDGWISPEGETYPVVNNTLHSSWVAEHRKWLEREYGFKVKHSELSNDMGMDYLRDRLIKEKHWMRVSNIVNVTTITLWNYESQIKKVLENINIGAINAHDNIMVYSMDRVADKVMSIYKPDVEKMLTLVAKYRLEIIKRANKI